MNSNALLPIGLHAAAAGLPCWPPVSSFNPIASRKVPRLCSRLRPYRRQRPLRPATFDPQRTSYAGLSMKQSSVEAEVDIDCSVEVAFATAGDRRRRIDLLPDNFDGARVTSEHTIGLGARFEFTVTTDRGAYRSVTDVTAWSPPHSFVEHTTDDASTYETHWSFLPAAAGVRVVMRTGYAPTGNPIVRLLLRRFEHRALQQSMMIELLRLKHLLEDAGQELIVPQSDDA